MQLLVKYENNSPECHKYFLHSDIVRNCVKATNVSSMRRIKIIFFNIFSLIPLMATLEQLARIDAFAKKFLGLTHTRNEPQNQNKIHELN